MPKYRIDVSAIVEVEAENVMQARDACDSIKLIGQRSELKRYKNDRRGSRRRVSILEFGISNPRRVRA